MIETTIQRRETARESRVRALVFFLALSVLLHGTFFEKEWILLGSGMAFLSAFTLWRVSFKLEGKRPWNNSKIDLGLHLSFTDGLFFGLVSLSLIGLIHPVKASEGLLDAVRWGTLWIVYRTAKTLQEEQSQYVLRWVKGIGLFIGVLGWVLSLSQLVPKSIPMLEGRLTSLFGYPNALAAYLCVALLLKPRSKWVRAILFISLLNTGSRAALLIFIIVWGAQRVLLSIARKGHHPSNRKNPLREKIFLVLLLSVGIFVTATWNQQAVAHLLNWGTSASLGERVLYFRDGIQLALLNKGLPRAGGWFAFPLVQNIPYWTTDPHSLFIRVLLHQGLFGVILVGLWGIWLFRSLGINLLRNFREKREVSIQSIGGASSLLFLALHSFVDTDFLFGSLGVLFWLIFGIYFSSSYDKFNKRRVPYPIESFYTRIEEMRMKRRILPLFIPTLGFGFVLLAVFVNPQWVHPEQALNDEITKLQESQNLYESSGINEENLKRYELLQQSINLNQTQIKVRQEFARLELEQHKSDGLFVIEEVIAWEKFNLRAYEWAQGVVLEEAEKCKESNVEEATRLYRWVESIPSRVVSIREVSSFEKGLWRGWENFQPSELNYLLEDYAKERQLTLR